VTRSQETSASLDASVKGDDWTPLVARKPEVAKRIEYRTRHGNTLVGWMTADDEFFLEEFDRYVAGASVVAWRDLPLGAQS
jgi:hypothetical protein